MKNSILQDKHVSDYYAIKNEKFGDFNEIRNAGFYRRYLYNVKLTPTYIKAYQLTEDEYVEHLEKRDTSHMIVLELLKSALIKRNNFVYSQTILLLRQIVA